MGRPRKYPEVSAGPQLAPPAHPDPDPRVEGPPTPEELADLEPGQLVSVALEWPRMKLTPAMVTALNETYRDVCLADDDDGKSLTRRIVARLRRAGHAELHPGCTRVTIDVPMLKRQDGRGVWYVRINERTYVGTVEVWECEARTILELVHYHQPGGARPHERREPHDRPRHGRHGHGACPRDSASVGWRGATQNTRARSSR